MRRIALFLWTAQVLAIGTLIAGVVNIESLVVTGPLLTLSGLGVAAATRRLGSWTTFLFGLSGPLLCMLVAFLIAANRLEPSDAQTPMMVVVIIGVLSMIPLALRSLRQIRRWPTTPIPQHARWRFSLWSLLVLVTGTCLVLVIARLLFSNLPSWHARPLFAWFIVVNLIGCASVLWLFLNSEPVEGSSGAMPTETDSPAV